MSSYPDKRKWIDTVHKENLRQLNEKTTAIKVKENLQFLGHLSKQIS